MKIICITEKAASKTLSGSGKPNMVYEMPDIPELSETGVRWIKNSCRDLNGHLVRGAYSDPNEAAGIIDEDPGIAFCLDVGTLNVCGQNPLEYIRVLGHRVGAVILRDNDGCHDKALLPFSSISVGGSHTDWRSVVLGLREIGFDGLLILDGSDSAAALPTVMKKRFTGYIRDMAEYFRWQLGMDKMVRSYDRCVLFGAGRMCRNYMKVYGEICPPLFTCDNAKHLWGTECAGLTVHDPQDLKGIPADVPIFLCNMYYEEISEQLMDMGLPNKTEWFSDEFMVTEG